MAGNRKALLIGVGRYEDERIEPLPVVAYDLARMHAVLGRSGYEIKVHTDLATLDDLGNKFKLGTTPGDRSFVADARANPIRKAIKEACQQADPADTLIIYLSGHGAQFDEEDVYFGHDASADETDSELFQATVVPLAHIAKYVNNSRAGATIVLIDACRNHLYRTIAAKGAATKGWSAGGAIEKPHTGKVYVFGCDIGQCCLFPPDGPSYFTSALVRVLDPSHDATTLGEVIEAASAILEDQTWGPDRQTLKLRRESEATSAGVLDRVICNGPEPDRWTPAALDSSLWDLVGSHPSKEDFRDAIQEIGKTCWGWHLKAVAADPDDPWRDPDSVTRCLKRLKELVDLVAKDVRLDAAEVAGLVVAPLVREGILAAGLVRLDDDKKNAAADPVPSPLNEARERHHRIAAQADRLGKREQDSDRDAVLAWLGNQAIADAVSLGHASASGGAVHPELRAALENLSDEMPALVRDTLTADRMIRLAFAGSSTLDPRAVVVGDDGTFDFRESLLGDLLMLAAAKSIDPRALPVVAVEHVGLTSGSLDPTQIIPFARRATWKGNVLAVKCDHPALHLALEELVKQAEEARARIAHGPLAGLPGPYLAKVAVAKTNNVPAYTTPLLQFQLDHNEVRELLMGETLYGDPNLAIRELYQNALDACRYRRARMEYRSRTHPHSGHDAYAGKITFIQDVDRGRPYIECRDNGIGMGIEELTGCFAKAGRRFAQMPESIRERAEWARLDPPIEVHPNSRFGVGVFSYFMLADEIQLWTRRLAPNGGPGPVCHHVTVPGSGSLFRIREADDLPQGGTRIRLYLNKTEHAGEPISCLDFLREILWVAEFETDVSADGIKQVWPVDRLMNPYAEPEDASRIDSPDPSIDAWWVDGMAAILSDGIAVAMYDPDLGDEEQFPIGPTVVNLRGNRRPQLTVDRKSIIALDLGAIHSVLKDGGPALDDWDRLSTEWIDRLLEADVALADRIVTHLMGRHRSIEIEFGQGHVATIDLAETGYARSDGTILGSWAGRSDHLNEDDRPLVPLRMALFKRAIKPLRDHAATSPANPLQQADRWIGPDADGEIPADCPAIGPIDALLIGAFSRPGLTSVASIVWAATTFGESIEQIASRVLRLESLQDRMPGFDRTSVAALRDHPDEVEIKPDDLRILSLYLNGGPPFIDAASPGHLVFAAVETGRPVSEVAGRLRELGVRVDGEPEAGLAVGRDDVLILSRNLDGRAPFIDAASPGHLAYAAVETGRSASEVAGRLRELGVRVVGEPEAGLAVGRDDLLILSRNLDGRAPFIDAASPGHLVFAAVETGRSASEVAGRLKRLGVRVDGEPEAGLAVGRDDLRILSHDLDGRSPFIDAASPGHVLLAAYEMGRKPAEIAARLGRLGVSVPEIPDDLTLDRDDFRVLSLLVDGRRPFLSGRIRPGQLAFASFALQRPIAWVYEKLRRLGPLGVEVPDVEGSVLGALGFQVERDHLVMLSRDWDGYPPWIARVEPAHVRRVAGRLEVAEEAVWAVLGRYAPLGLILPDGGSAEASEGDDQADGEDGDSEEQRGAGADGDSQDHQGESDRQADGSAQEVEDSHDNSDRQRQDGPDGP